MRLKVPTPTPIRPTTGSKSKDGHQKSLSHDRGITKTSSSSKLKALVKNGKKKALKMKEESTKALVKVLPKSAVPSSGEKRDYDTDSSSQDHTPLLPDYEGSTDEESSNSGRVYKAQFRPIIDHEQPTATRVVVDESPRTPSPKQPTREVQQTTRQKTMTRKEPTTNVNSHRSRAFYAAAKNEKKTEETPKEEVPTKFPVLTCHLPQFPSDVSGISDCDAQPVQDQLNMEGLKLVSKAALLKALQVSGAIINKGSTLCTKGAVNLDNLSTMTQTTPVCSMSLQQPEQAGYPEDEAPAVIEKPPKKLIITKNSRRHGRRKKEKTLPKEDAANREIDVKVDNSDDFFLMTVEDIQEISKMVQEFATEASAENGGKRGLFGCHQAKDVVEWLLCISVQGGGRHAMTKKQTRTRFADADMQDGHFITDAETKFTDDDMTFSSKGSIEDSYASAAFMEQDDISVVQENEDDSDSDDDDDFCFDEQTITTAKNVHQFRPTGMIRTEDLAVVYGGNMEQLEDTIETVLILDDKNYSDSNAKRFERADSEYGDGLPTDSEEGVVNTEASIPNFEETKFNYSYEHYQVNTEAKNKEIEGPMELEAIVCENMEGNKCWDNLSIITPQSAQTATSQHTAMHRRLQQLETELARMQKEYHEITDSNAEAQVQQEAMMAQFHSEPYDDSSIDGPKHALQSGGDSKSVRSAELQSKRVAIKMLQEEKDVLEKRVHELVSMMEASKLCHSKQLSENKKASQAQLEELRYEQKCALEEAKKKIQDLESSVSYFQTNMVDIQAKYSRDLEAAKLLQSNKLQEIQYQQNATLDLATSKIEELELNLQNEKMRLKELDENHSRKLEAAKRAQSYKARERDMRESDLRCRLDEVEYNAEKDRKESDRKVREIREEHTKQIEEMIRQLDVVVAEHEKEHAKEYEKLIGQLDLVVAEHEEKCNEMDKLAKEKDALIANLGSQLAAAQSRLVEIGESS